MKKWKKYQTLKVKKLDFCTIALECACCYMVSMGKTHIEGQKSI